MRYYEHNKQPAASPYAMRRGEANEWQHLANLCSLVGGRCFFEDKADEKLTKFGEWLLGLSHVFVTFATAEPGWGDWGMVETVSSYTHEAAPHCFDNSWSAGWALETLAPSTDLPMFKWFAKQLATVINPEDSETPASQRALFVLASVQHALGEITQEEFQRVVNESL